MQAEGSPLALLVRAAARAPAAEALVCGAVRLDYGHYLAAVTAFAAQLGAGGAGGRAVALLLRNGIELPIAIFAAQAAGASACALNPDYTVRELGAMLAIARPAVAVTHGDLVETLRVALGTDFDGTIIALPPDAGAWVRTLSDGHVSATVPLPDPASVAVIQFTGGTTGRAKGVALSHAAVAANVAQREAVLPTVWGDERIICMMPLFHSFAAAMGLHLAANCAGALHVLPRYRPDWVLDTIEREAITRLPAGPTVFTGLLGFDGLRRDRLTSLRCAWSGSAPLSAETLRRWEAATGVPIYEGYGQSEAGPILTYHGPGMVQKQGSVGPALPDTRIEIVDVETGMRVLPAGAAGEIRARGPQLMDGYLGDAAATADALRDGWLMTGDIGRLDTAGYLFIEDRKKDMAIVGGYNVYPREVDEVMMACPGVAEAAAVGVPDAYRGELLWAFYTGEPVDLAAWVAPRLVKYKHPAQFVRLETLPKTPVGKIDKAALKRLAKAG